MNNTPETDAHLLRDYDKYYTEGGLPCSAVDPDFAENLEIQRNEAREQVEMWKQYFIAFAVPHVGKYGLEHFGDGCLHYTHYDLLEKAGARMDDFKRCGDPYLTTEFTTAP